MEKFDFSGWATRNDLLCGDGRTIRKDAFKHNDGQTVPLVWNHQHNEPDNVLGHALLENRDEGVYAYCTFNESESGKAAKELVRHGDVRSLSIYANKLKQSGGDVLHGVIREVSLVLAGANPGAFIDSVLAHGEGTEDGLIVGYDENIMLYHSDDSEKKEDTTEEIKKESEPKKEEDAMANDAGDKTVQDVIDSMTEEQKTVMYAMIGQAIEENPDTDDNEDEDSEGGDEDMKHNVFDQDEMRDDVLTHSDMAEIFSNAKRYGSLRDAVNNFAESRGIGDDELSHAVTDSQSNTVTYGMADIDYLFPEAKSLNTPPAFIQRKNDWVQIVMQGVHHTPFSRIKSMFANITNDEARAKGYVKGNKKVEEVFTLLKRTTTPTTIYKKQKLDRDDIVDITDFDVVAWLKSEMRMMLDEEIARAILVGDGRSTSDDDHINEGNIRPIWKDDDLYTIKATVEYSTTATEGDKAKAFIQKAIRARKDYRGSGNPVLYTTEDVLTECLLMEDGNGRVIYDSIDKLATAMRVSRIVTVPVMEGLTRTSTEGSKNYEHSLLGIIVNLNDYNVGADKGGAVNMFDDFDIDYNQQKYLIETRCSGALTVPYSAIALETKVAK